MNRHPSDRVLCWVFVLVMLVGTSALGAEGKPEVDPADMMKAFAEITTPGDKHALLERWVGTWELDMGVVMPGMPNQRSKGTAECRWQLPGRWIACEIDGSLMGAPYRSFGIFGYDNFKKKHVWTGIDSSSTAMLRAEGVMVDPTEKVQALYGNLDEYLNGEHDKPFKVVIRWQDADHHVVEVWDLGIGEAGAKVLDFHYQRKK